jgi:hypothetical protein
VLTIWVCNFLAKGFWRKFAHKMLVTLTPAQKEGVKILHTLGTVAVLSTGPLVHAELSIEFKTG